MTEPNRKTLRSFYCRDYLWDLFEVMTRDLGCSMDYLVNEAMRHYARSRNYALTGAQPPGGAGSPVPPPPPGAAPPYASPQAYDHPTFSRMPAIRQGAGGPPPAPGYATPPPPPGYAGPPPQGQRFNTPSPSPAAYGAAGAMPPPPPGAPGTHPGVHPGTHPNAPMHRPGPPSPPMPPQAGPPRPRLTLIFDNKPNAVAKDKFIIGRGSTMTDLTIRDGNVSRKHAAVIFRNGQWYIKDLDSTNGIDYRGNRIDSKKIEEGDIFHICDYELRFTYA